MRPEPRPGEPDGRALPYRPEIDGLRAVAVLAVVLYHYGVPIRGGFAGVDVFFVISGYLIGGLLLRERASTGRIALGAFYLRRVRRLLPAYFAMAGVTAAVAWVVLLPFEFREFGKSLIAATVWLSNVQFWREAGYFDIAATGKALLHTWSLSVEEQFYLVLPLLLIAVRRRAVAVLWVLGIASLAAGVWWTPERPAAAFFLFPFRAWELLAGVLLARWAMAGGTVPGVVSWLGLGLIVASLFGIKAAGFPGWQAILPVAGTVMVLAGAGGRSGANRILSMRGPVFIGVISYSLYLWHWPVLVLSRYWRDGYAGPVEAAGWLTLAVVLAVVAWAAVERPLRRARIPARGLIGGAVAAGVVLIAIGGAVFLRDGMPGRFPDAVRAQVAASGDFLQDMSRCGPGDGALSAIEVCRIGPEGAPEVVFWGDSHLRATMDGIAAAAAEAGVPGVIVWHAGCPPLFGVRKSESAATPAEDAACAADTEALREALPGLGAARIVLVARWAYYAEGAGVGLDAGNGIALDDGADGDVYGRALVRTVEELSESFARVAVMRQVPEIPAYDSRVAARGLAHGRLTEADVAAMAGVSDEALAARMRAAEAPIMALAAEGAIEVIDPWPVLCPARCTAMPGGVPLYFDNNHLTNRGAMALRDLFAPMIAGLPDA